LSDNSAKSDGDVIEEIKALYEAMQKFAASDTGCRYVIVPLDISKIRYEITGRCVRRSIKRGKISGFRKC
jgi:hypothetical protein